MSTPGDGLASERDDAQLLAGLRAGDDVSYERLVRTHGGRMLMVARSMLRNEEEARDAVQDAFLSAFRAIGDFQGDSRLSTWLHRIVVNAALMKLRTRRRKPEESIDAFLPKFQEDGHFATPVFEWKDSALGRLESEQLDAFVRRAIERLPDTYREILILRDIEELNTAETGKMLHISANAVKTRLHRARQALRGVLAPELGGGRP